MKKLLALLLAVCMTLTMMTSAFAEDFVINVCVASEPETIDPGMVNSVDGSMMVQHMFESLMKYELNGQVVADDPSMVNTDVVLGQAASYEVSEDLTVYTFTLRDDIVWTDGKPVVAGDFEYAWKRVVDPALASDYGYILDGVVKNAAAIQAGEMDPSELGIVALDDKTLQITLEAPCAYFLSLCAFATLMPVRQDVIEADPLWATAGLVSNGPYKITEWVHDSYIKMEKNETYYNVEALGPDAIVWHLSDSETAILASYQTGELDFIESFPTDMIEPLKASGDCFVNPYIGTYYLYLNCNYIPDWRVRAALTLSIDRENIVENVTQGGQTPATGLVAAGVFDSTGADFSEASEMGALFATLQEMYPDFDLTMYSDRCALAQQLYDEAVADGGWDANTTVVYNFNTSETHKAIAEACGADWESVLGIKISLQNQEWATYTSSLGEHQFGVARLGWIADYNDPITYLELMITDQSNNYGVYSDATYDEMVRTAKTMLNGTERDQLLYDAEAYLFGEGGFPVAPLYFYTQVYCMRDGIDNIGFTPLGYFFFDYATQAK